MARNKFCWGLGVRAVRAGSIGRDDPRLEENADSPKWGREGLAPASPRRSQRLMVPADRPNPQARVPLGFRVADLGTDVSPESFARACRENKADLAGISAPSQLHHAEYGRGGEGDPRRKPRDQNHGERRAADRGDRPENGGRRLCAGRLPAGEKSRGAARREEVERMEPECRSSNTRTETSGPS